MALFICALFPLIPERPVYTQKDERAREVIISTSSGQAVPIVVVPLAPSSPLLCIGMAAASVYNTRVSADGYSQRHDHDHHRPPSPTTSLSPTLVNDAHYTARRPSLKLRIPGGASNILNSMVVNTAGQSLYSVLSDSKRTTLISCRDNVEIATVQWDRHSPRMVFHRKKVKCKEWLKLTGTNNEYIPAPRLSS
jgi:hypothetical protein